MAFESLGCIARREGRYSEAYSDLEQATATYREVGHRADLALCQAELGYVLALEGHQDAAWAQFVQGLRGCVALDDRRLTARGLGRIGCGGVHLRRFQRAAELLGLYLRRTPEPSHPELWSKHELDMLRVALGAEVLDAALARGAELDLDQVVAEILACDTPEAYWGIETEGPPAESNAP
jgi:hypothetical protein